MTPEQMKTLGIPDEFHNEQIFKDAPDLPTVFKVARDLNTYKGNSIRVPGPEAGDPERTEFASKLKKHAPHLIEIPKEDDKAEAFFLERLGAPKEAKDYAPPQNHGLSDEAVEALRAEAVEEKLTKRQFEARVERAKAQQEKAQKAHGEALASLKKDLGSAYEERLSLAAATAKSLGADEAAVKAIQEGKAPVASIRQMLAVAKSLGSTPNDLGIPGGSKGALTPDEIRSRVQEIYRNPAFQQKDHPQYQDLQKKLLDYNSQLYPDE